MVQFESKVLKVNDRLIALLPEEASKQLTSRGQVCVEGTINGITVKTVLEPDGRWGHWIRMDNALQTLLSVKEGDTLTAAVEPSKDWPEPVLPADFQKALNAAPDKVKDKWQVITPMARWEWIRWVNATGSSETRAIRIEKSISKLNGKHRRPCCFNLAACTDPDLSKSGRLIVEAAS